MTIHITDQISSAEISPLGAELQSYRVYGKERIWQRDPALWSGSATVLFPFIGRCREDSYLYGGRRYPMGLHGFAWKREFRLLDQGGSHCLLELTDDRDTREIYPFSFSLRLGFSLHGGALSVHFQVRNRSGCGMPFALGWHPGFLLEGGLEHYAVAFPNGRSPEEVEIVPKCMVTGRTLPLEEEQGLLPLGPSLFRSGARLYRGMGSPIRLIDLRSGPLLELDCPGFPITTLWQTVGSNAPFLCIEPWLGRPGRADKIEELGTDEKALLPPGGTLSRAVTLSFSDRRRGAPQ